MTYVASPHAGIYAVSNANPVGILVKATAVQGTDWDANHPYSGPVPDSGNSHITIDRTGVFLIVVSATVNSGAGAASKFEMTVRTNAGTAELPGLHCDRNLAGGGGVAGVISMSGIVALTAADTVEVWIEDETNAVDYVVEDIDLSIVRVNYR